ncbi:MAG: alpha-E domain-containing protein [Betaproteobacteria bacterium]|nr:alpha-E domain-containing protein [Betaproteobacteria bacterium]
MLSRTADHLFWMARYIERAENTARMLDANLQAVMLPQSTESIAGSWRALLGISELEPQYLASNAEFTPAAILEFMVWDEGNSSSIVSCLRAARENARAVRGTLTAEVWETLNATWLELRSRPGTSLRDRRPAELFEWVRFRSHQSRGVMFGTMLKDEAFHFARIGTFIERADNTARILDVKFFEHATANAAGVQGLDETHDDRLQREFYHWAAVLRSLSAFEIYRKVYKDIVTPARVAELLMLRADMPRSLLASMNEVALNLEAVRKDSAMETERRAGLLRTELHYGRIDDILVQGLHAYLSGFLARVNDLAERISRDYLVPLTPHAV